MKFLFHLKTIDDNGNPCLVEIKANEAGPEKQDTPTKHVAFVNQKRKNAGYKKALKLDQDGNLVFSGGSYKET
jgi:hypothetical protein